MSEKAWAKGSGAADSQLYEYSIGYTCTQDSSPGKKTVKESSTHTHMKTDQK